MNKKGSRHRKLNDEERATNRTKSLMRTKVAHAFGMIERQFDFTKVRHKGGAKNAFPARLLRIDEFGVREKSSAEIERKSFTGKLFLNAERLAAENGTTYKRSLFVRRNGHRIP